MLSLSLPQLARTPSPAQAPRKACLCSSSAWPGKDQAAGGIKVSAASQDSWQVLGVDPGADEAAIKKAFRKLALKAHPDQAKNPGAASDFVRIMQAYDTLLGRHRGKTAEMTQPSKRESWEFHDWYWQFAANRRWSSKQGKQQAAAASSSPFHSTPASAATTQAQLAGLKRKAAFRQVKARHAQHAEASSSPSHVQPAAPAVSRPAACSFSLREETISSYHQPVDMTAWAAASSPVQHTQSTGEEDFLHESTQLGDELEASIKQSLDSLYINMQLAASLPAVQVINAQQRASSTKGACADAPPSYAHAHASTWSSGTHNFMQTLMSHRARAVLLHSHLPEPPAEPHSLATAEEQPAAHAVREAAEQHAPADPAEGNGPMAGSLSGFSHVQSQLAGLKRRPRRHAQ